MKIIDKRVQVMQYFHSNLLTGTIFEYAGRIYMKVANVCDDESYYNVLCLNDGKFAYFENEQVQVLSDVALEIH